MRNNGKPHVPSRNSGRNSGNRPGTFTGKGDPRNGRGPAKGAPNAGRPPKEYVGWCQSMISDPSCEAAVARILADDKHPAFATMYKTLSDRGHGRAAQPVNVGGEHGDSLLDLIIGASLVGNERGTSRGGEAR